MANEQIKCSSDGTGTTTEQFAIIQLKEKGVKNTPNKVIFYASDSYGNRAPSLKLSIQSQSSAKMLEAIRKQPQHGYTKENSVAALQRFIKRRIVIQDASEVSRTANNIWEEQGHNVLKRVSIPSLFVRQVPFETSSIDSHHFLCTSKIIIPAERLQSTGANDEVKGPRFYVLRKKAQGFSKEDAEANCALEVLKEMYDFDVIREASVELYSPLRKPLLDPTLELDGKLRAWLDNSSDTFLQHLAAIASNSNNFQSQDEKADNEDSSRRDHLQKHLEGQGQVSVRLRGHGSEARYWGAYFDYFQQGIAARANAEMAHDEWH